MCGIRRLNIGTHTPILLRFFISLLYGPQVKAFYTHFKVDFLHPSPGWKDAKQCCSLMTHWFGQVLHASSNVELQRSLVKIIPSMPFFSKIE